MVGNALREHLRLGRIERVGVLPDRFPGADSRVAVDVRWTVFGPNSFDQEFSLAGAVVHRRSGAEVPTHGGFGIRESSARGDDGVGAPLVDVRLRRRPGVARVRVFPDVYLGSGKIRERSAGDQRAYVECWTSVERFIAAVIHASN